MKNKLFFSLVFAILFTLSSCSLGNFFTASNVSYDILVGNLDNLKVSQYYMIRDFESSKELAITEKDPNQLYGIGVSENYNKFVTQALNLSLLFESLTNFSEDEGYILDYFTSVYKPLLNEYVEYCDMVYNKIITSTLSESDYENLMKEFDEKSEKFFYDHVDMVNIVLKHNWGIEIFKANE
ncbi:MAG: hypothetical protein RBS56_01885 [Candidatus Gracilibacteria bacterium]|jgi:hypothetical protein|nr:hypothetical protein [Candidatus Gracilibacteria bacterium]